jgi:hypothetical protein
MPDGSMIHPRLVRVRQRFPRPRVEDPAAATREALSVVARTVGRGESVAIGVGSRGISHIASITRATVEHVREVGGVPFVFPAMGSHGGATAEGQVALLAHLGVTEQAIGCPIRSSMEVVQVGEALGLPVWFDRIAQDADRVAVINRIKPHTGYKGPIESGLMKMLAFGAGKHEGAALYHRATFRHGYLAVVRAMAGEVLARCRIAFGLAVIENGYEEVARVQACAASDIAAVEPALLAEAKGLLPALPASPLDVLVVDEIGKNISGTQLDPNVIGRAANKIEPWPEGPTIRWIVALDLTDETQGNAAGIGLVDLISRRVHDKLDWHATITNALSASNPFLAKLPPAFDSDRQAIEAALGALGLTPPEEARLVRIRNTLRLDEIEVSESLIDECRQRDGLEVLGTPRAIAFDAAGALPPLAFGP